MTTKDKKVQIKKKISHGFQTHLRRLLVSVNDNAQVSGDVLSQLQSLMHIIAKNISARALESCQNAKKKTIAIPDVILGSIQILGPGPVIQKSRIELNKAMKRQEEYDKSEDETSKKKKVVRREEKAGIIISVSQCAKYLKNFGSCNNNVTQGAHLTLAIVLQELMSLIFTESLKISKKEKKITIKIKHITSAINDNEYLRYMMKKNNIVFIKGLLQPEFSFSYKNKKGSKVSTDIKKYKKSEDLLLQKKPFMNDVKQVLARCVKKSDNEDYRVKFGFGSPLILQHLVENILVETLSTANKLSSRSNRKTVKQEDLELAIKITEFNKNLRTENAGKNYTSSISDAGIKRCARKAGILVISSAVTPTCKSFVYELLHNFMYSCVNILQTRKIVNLTIKTVQEALTQYNISCMTPVFQKKKKIKAKVQEKNGEDESFEVTTTEG